MITEIVNTIAAKLVLTNSAWLKQIRSLGYLAKTEAETVIYDQEVKEIGLDDRNGNSGYIRFGSDQNFTVNPIPAKVSKYAYQYKYALRLVIVVKTDYPANINYLLSLQLNHLDLGSCTYATGTASNIMVQTASGGSNTIANAKNESGVEIKNNNYKVVYIDFVVKFDDHNSCDFTQKIILPMECGCASILDLECVGSCDDITIPIVSLYTGDATVRTIFNGNYVTIPVEVVTGEEIVVNAEHLNADYTFNLQVFNEDGEQLTYSEDPSGTVYDCFQIKIIPS